MNKIATETRYKNMSFTLIKELNNLRIFLSEYSDYCIIVDQKDIVLFEIKADSGEDIGYLKIAS